MNVLLDFHVLTGTFEPPAWKRFGYYSAVLIFQKDNF